MAASNSTSCFASLLSGRATALHPKHCAGGTWWHCCQHPLSLPVNRKPPTHTGCNDDERFLCKLGPCRDALETPVGRDRQAVDLAEEVVVPANPLTRGLGAQVHSLATVRHRGARRLWGSWRSRRAVIAARMHRWLPVEWGGSAMAKLEPDRYATGGTCGDTKPGEGHGLPRRGCRPGRRCPGRARPSGRRR